MASSDIENQFDKKIRLENEKLQIEVTKLKNQKTPHWIFTYLQPIIPTLFTVSSLIITAIILSHLHVFEVNSKLNQIARLDFIKDTTAFGIKKKSNDSTIAIQKTSIDSLNGVLDGLRHRLKNDSNAMKKFREDKSGKELQLLTLRDTISKIKSEKNEMQIRLLSVSQTANKCDITIGNLLEKNRKLDNRISYIIGQANGYNAILDDLGNNITSDSAYTKRTFKWAKQEYQTILYQMNKYEPN